MNRIQLKLFYDELTRLRSIYYPMYNIILCEEAMLRRTKEYIRAFSSINDHPFGIDIYIIIVIYI